MLGAVERHAAGEGLADELVGDRHVGDDDVLVAFLDAPAHPQRLAQRHELRIVLDIGDEVEHVGGGMASRAAWWRIAASITRRPSRARAFSRAKSSPA